MPLVTLTCSSHYYPPDDPVSSHTTEQGYIAELARELPQMMLDCKISLKMGDTPEEAIQVDIKRFHEYSINTVDLWMHVWFTEPGEHYGDKGRDMVRDTLASLIRVWMKNNKLEFSWALDIFFGPGTGCYADSKGKIQQIW